MVGDKAQNKSPAVVKKIRQKADKVPLIVEEYAKENLCFGNSHLLNIPRWRC